MFILHLGFECLFRFELEERWPQNKQGYPFDPRRDPYPLWNRLFGLPSMWFSSAEAKQRLLEWINKVHPGKVYDFLAPEIGFYAKVGTDERKGMAEALKHA